MKEGRIYNVTPSVVINHDNKVIVTLTPYGIMMYDLPTSNFMSAKLDTKDKIVALDFLLNVLRGELLRLSHKLTKDANAVIDSITGRINALIEPEIYTNKEFAIADIDYKVRAINEEWNEYERLNTVIQSIDDTVANINALTESLSILKENLRIEINWWAP